MTYHVQAIPKKWASPRVSWKSTVVRTLGSCRSVERLKSQTEETASSYTSYCVQKVLAVLDSP